MKEAAIHAATQAGGGKKQRNRKTLSQRKKDYLAVLKLLHGGCPEREIMLLLDLSREQVRTHMVAALRSKEIMQEELCHAYEVCRAKALPMAVRTVMNLDSPDAGEKFLRATSDGNGGCHLAVLDWDSTHVQVHTTTIAASSSAGDRE